MSSAPRIKVNLLGKSAAELSSIAVSLGEPAYRGRQLYHALYAERRFEFTRMTNLPAEFHKRLAGKFEIRLPEIVRRYQSSDGSVRYLLAIDDDGKSRTQVEAVFMPDESRQTICISTQAGCAVDCHFCLTAQLGLNRNLSAGEIVGQVLVTLEDSREKLAPQTNVVLMGQGEPLLNYEPVMEALRIILDPEGMGLSSKHVTLSTSGIVPAIEKLGAEPVRPKLAVSLNASNDQQRDAIMPINRKYPLGLLLSACRDYQLRNWEWLTFEYVMLGGFNDSEDDARRVVKLLANIRAKVNLIPWNPGELPYRPPPAENVEAFRKILGDKGVPVFIRYSRGQDVMAACGQLALLEAGEQPRLVSL